MPRCVYGEGTPFGHPLILHIADMSALRDIAEDIPEAAVDLAEAFWPGPLTLVLKKRRNVSSVVSGGLDTVAVRMPDNDLARRLIRALGHPLAGPSANLSGHPSPTLAAHVEHDFGDHIAGVVGRRSVPRGGGIDDRRSDGAAVCDPASWRDPTRKRSKR